MAALYRVQALTTNGQQVRAVVKARSMDDARSLLQERFPGACVVAELAQPSMTNSRPLASVSN